MAPSVEGEGGGVILSLTKGLFSTLFYRGGGKKALTANSKREICERLIGKKEKLIHFSFLEKEGRYAAPFSSREKGPRFTSRKRKKKIGMIINEGEKEGGDDESREGKDASSIVFAKKKKEALPRHVRGKRTRLYDEEIKSLNLIIPPQRRRKNWLSLIGFR